MTYDPQVPRKNLGTYPTNLQEVLGKVRARQSQMGSLAWVLTLSHKSYLQGVGHFNIQGDLVGVYYFNRAHRLCSVSEFTLGSWVKDPENQEQVQI